MSYTLRLAGCDETKHPYCEGVITPASAEMHGLPTIDRAWEQGREAISEEWNVQDVIDLGGVALSRSTPSTILRDFIVVETKTQRVVEPGDHDDYDIFN